MHCTTSEMTHTASVDRPHFAAAWHLPRAEFHP